MKGHGFKNVVAENLSALSALRHHNQRTYTKPKLCWRCQKEKLPAGGHISTYAGGPLKFICKECMETMKAKREEKNMNTTTPTTTQENQ
jgi:hypothetical protein